MPAGKEEKTLNPYKRWKGKVGKVWKAYTEIGNPIEMWKPIAAGIGANILKSIETKPEERHGLIEDIVGGAITILRTGFQQYSHHAPYDIMPALRRHLSAAEGASDLKYLYVYYKGGPEEYPIYLSGGEIPEDDLLRDNIKYVDDTVLAGNPKSPYEDDALDFKGKIKGLFDMQDGPPVLNIATLYDYAEYYQHEPQKAYRWAVKDDTWIANQYGPRNFAMEAALPADLTGKVRIYERPVKTTGFWYRLGELIGDKSPRSGRMWFEWVVKKPLIYIPGDLLLEPLEATLEKILPPETLRSLIFEKARGINATWRGMTNPRSEYLWYG
ncbi:MAG: hypothetical protein KAU24_03745 [Candidatus Aenigmarchaeota archaeon]|nr:hypothetical protein [Candidatus Aenigmarchaeota archaeon]